MVARLRRESADIGIVTNALSRSLAFYSDVLGFQPAGHVDIPGLGAMYRLESPGTKIKIIDSSAAQGLAENVEPAAGLTLATGLRYFTLHIENLDEVVARCRNFGSGILSEPVAAAPGVRFAMVLDPDRVVIELAETT
jgi:catechol 2,3-dioxygenase-like lactoylglutathione lyase family enzyme